MDFACLPEIFQSIILWAIHPILGNTFADEQLFDSIIDWQKRHHNVELTKDNIILNTGIVYALYLLITLFVKENEKIIVQPPVYPPFFNTPAQLNREVVFSPLINKDNEWLMDFVGFEKAFANDPKIKMYILCNPHNPTGKCYSKEDLRKIADYSNVVMLSSPTKTFNIAELKISYMVTKR